MSLNKSPSESSTFSSLSLHPSPLLEDPLLQGVYEALVKSPPPSRPNGIPPSSPSLTSTSADAPTDAELGLPSIRDEVFAVASPSVRPLAAWFLKAPCATVLTGFARSRIAAALAVALNVLHADDCARRVLLITSSDRTACVWERVLARDCDELNVSKFPTAPSKQEKVLQLLRKTRRPGVIILSQKLLRNEVMQRLRDSVRSGGVWDLVLSDIVCSDSALNETSCPLRVLADRGATRAAILACSESGPPGLTIDAVRDFIQKQIGISGDDAEPDRFWGTPELVKDVEVYPMLSGTHLREHHSDHIEAKKMSEKCSSKRSRVTTDVSPKPVSVPMRKASLFSTQLANSHTATLESKTPMLVAGGAVENLGLKTNGGTERDAQFTDASESVPSRPIDTSKLISASPGKEEVVRRSSHRKNANIAQSLLENGADVEVSRPKRGSRKDSKRMKYLEMERLGKVLDTSTFPRQNPLLLSESRAGIEIPVAAPASLMNRRGTRTSRRSSAPTVNGRNSAKFKDSTLNWRVATTENTNVRGRLHKMPKKLESPIRRRTRSGVTSLLETSPGSDTSIAESLWKTPVSEPKGFPEHAPRSLVPMFSESDQWITPLSQFPSVSPQESSLGLDPNCAVRTQKETLQRRNSSEALETQCHEVRKRPDISSRSRKSDEDVPRKVGVRLFEESNIASLYPSSTTRDRRKEPRRNSTSREKQKRVDSLSNHQLETPRQLPKLRNVRTKSGDRRRKPLGRRISQENVDRKKASGRKLHDNSKSSGIIEIDTSGDDDAEMEKLRTPPPQVSRENSVISISDDEGPSTPRHEQTCPPRMRNPRSSSRRGGSNDNGASSGRKSRSPANTERIMLSVSYLPPGVGRVTHDQRSKYNSMVKTAKRCLSLGYRDKALDLYTKCLDLYDGDDALKSVFLALSTASNILKPEDFKERPSRRISRSHIGKDFRSPNRNHRGRSQPVISQRGGAKGRRSNGSKPLPSSGVICLD